MRFADGDPTSSSRSIRIARTTTSPVGIETTGLPGARVVLDCVYPLARDHLTFPELPREYEPHSVREVHFIQWEQPRLVVDISETMEVKLEAIRCHASQIGDFKDFEARMRNRAAILGKEKGYLYAEGFDQIVVPG